MGKLEKPGAIIRHASSGGAAWSMLTRGTIEFEGGQLPPIAGPLTRSSDAAPCSACKGAGYTRLNVAFGHSEFGKAQICQCRLRERARSLFGGSQIPFNLRSCTFASFEQLAISEEQRQAARRVQAFTLRSLENYTGYKRGLYIYGLWGRGKTGLAIAALRLVAQTGQSALYLPTFQLFDTLREAIAASKRLERGYGDQDDREEESEGARLLRLVDAVSWLVLDDLGVQCASAFIVSRLYALLEGRRAKGLFTIFTSNKDAYGLEHNWRPESSSVAYEDCARIIERIGEYCVPISVEGNNLRERP